MRLLPPRFFVRIIFPVLLFSLAAALLAIAPSSVNQSMGSSASSQDQTPIAQSKVVQHSEVQFGDRYRGTTVHVQKGTGYFTVSKVGDRWTFVTPEGNAFWLLSVYATYHAFLESTVAAKYGGDWSKWYTHRNQRLLDWGFNTLGEYNETQGLPIDMNGLRSANSVKLPFIAEINAMTAMRGHPAMFGISEAPKDIVPGVPATTYKLWRGSRMTDMFDPKLTTAYHNVVAYQNNRVYDPAHGGFNSVSWLIGITTDDTDVLFGIKETSNPNVGYMVAVVKPQYTAAENRGVTPVDPKLYSKYAWVDMLRAKYGTIQALNAAWRSNYTSFDDDGGYGAGTGLLDEDGRHTAWLGNDAVDLSSARPAVKVDMNAFVYRYAYQYAKAAVDAIRAYDQHHLIFGPMALGAAGRFAIPQVLQAFSDAGINVIQMGADLHGDMRGAKAAYDQLGKPVYLWYAVSANADSALYPYPNRQEVLDLRTQAARATQYAADLQTFFNAQGTNGDKYILGIDWWALTDGRAYEKSNWGLITRNDNAYDGKEAVRRAGTDSAGFHTGGEERDYGDFLSTVRNTNFEIQTRLTRDLATFARSPDRSKK